MTTKVLILNFGPKAIEILTMTPMDKANQEKHEALMLDRDSTTSEPHRNDLCNGKVELFPQQTFSEYVHDGRYYVIREK